MLRHEIPTNDPLRQRFGVTTAQLTTWYDDGGRIYVGGTLGTVADVAPVQPDDQPTTAFAPDPHLPSGGWALSGDDLQEFRDFVHARQTQGGAALSNDWREQDFTGFLDQNGWGNYRNG